MKAFIVSHYGKKDRGRIRKVPDHSTNYVVFSGMKNSGTIRQILFLDRETKAPGRRSLQRSIEKVVETEKYEWLTIRVHEDGIIRDEQ
jgi:predicted Holliday junction resolvase-like endonuclease